MMGPKIGGHVERVNGKEVSYGEFVERYLVKNQPVVLTGLMDGWRACHDWVTHDNRPNLSFFSSRFGNSRVQVADCGTREFTDQKRVELSVSEFTALWPRYSSEDCYSASNHKHNCESSLYLKDWHFVKEYPHYLAYTTPLIFFDDWLNLYLDNYRMHKDPDVYQEKNEICCSDYRFVYMGAKGTWTPLHADVFRSYSWSANVCGKKRWYFLPPDQVHLVFDRNNKDPVFDIFEDVSELKFHGFKETIWLECTQEQNEIIFVPSGWYHQVHNLEDTISINHNWFNAYNLSWVWDLLLKDYNEAKEHIEDIKDICDDFEGLCQRNLAANTGMNFNDFFVFITRFSFANLIHLHLLARNDTSSTWRTFPRAQHMVFNLKSTREIAQKMKSAGLSGNYGILIDLRKTLQEPAFLKLCAALGKTYSTIHEHRELSSDAGDCFLDDLVELEFTDTCSTRVSDPQDLVELIDYHLSKLSCNSL